MKNQFEILFKYPDLYKDLNLESQKSLEKYLETLSVDRLAYLLDTLPISSDSSLFKLVAKVYAKFYATNLYQVNLLVESLAYKREAKRNDDIDCYNYGKHCKAFSRRKSKGKGKAYARVRATKINFR